MREGVIKNGDCNVRKNVIVMFEHKLTAKLSSLTNCCWLIYLPALHISLPR